MKRVAVVGGGIAGLAAARVLGRTSQVTLYEAGDHFGGHSRTIDVTLGGRTHAVDAGFVVFDARHDTEVTALFAELGVATTPAEVSFSVQIPSAGVEWRTPGWSGVFAQPSNLLRPGLWSLPREIARFRKLGTLLLGREPSEGGPSAGDPLGDFLEAHRFSAAFRDWCLLPMVASIWSCPTEQALRFPVAMLLRFCAEHGALEAGGTAGWRSVRGGASIYVDKMLDAITDARLATPVTRVRRLSLGGAEVSTTRGSERFDAVVLACHSDQSLALLADPSEEEREVLGAIRWQRNRAVVHTDARFLPERRAAWAAWNYEHPREPPDATTPPCLHTLVNRLQPLPFDRPVIVSLNPLHEPASALVQGEFHYAHPVFERRAVAAQARLASLQGERDTWYCGAWTRHGTHEDGLVSALAVCGAIGERAAAPVSATSPSGESRGTAPPPRRS
jgi:predicted NAD/FAD-binding protein